jgi:hypothetical protein
MDTVPHRLRGKVDLDNFEKAGGTVAARSTRRTVRTTTISRGKLPLTLDRAAPWPCPAAAPGPAAPRVCGTGPRPRRLRHEVGGVDRPVSSRGVL